MSTNKVLTRKEVSEYTGIGITTLLRLTKKGDLPCFRATYPNGRTLYYLKDVDSFLERQKKLQEEQVKANKKG